LAARFLSRLPLDFATDPLLIAVRPVRLTATHLQVGPAPTRPKTLCKVPGVLGKRIDINPEWCWTVRIIAAAKRIID